MDIFTVLFYQPVFNIMVVLYRLLGENLGLSIIAIALIFRIVTIPITMRQIKMAEQSKVLNEKIAEIKKKYKNNKEKQSQEMVKVQSEYLPGQLAGCLPIIVQLILLINMYHVIQDLFTKGAVAFNAFAYPFVPAFVENYQINYDFLGIPLQSIANNVPMSDLRMWLPVMILALLTAITQYLSTKIMMGMNKAREEKNAQKNGMQIDAKSSKSKPAKKKNDKDAEEMPDFAEIMQQTTKQTMFILPLLTFFAALNFPAGLSLYWTVQSGFVIIQQYFVNKIKDINDTRIITTDTN